MVSTSPSDNPALAFSALRQMIAPDERPAVRSAFAALAVAMPGPSGAAAVLDAYGLVERFSLREPERLRGRTGESTS